MKKVFEFIFGCIVTLILTVVMVLFLGHLLDPKGTENGIIRVKAFQHLDPDSLDVIVYGSSHARRGVDTKKMFDEYHLNAYNYATNWQSINTTLLYLQNSFRTQSPKVVCIDTYKVNSVEQDTDLDGQIYNTRGIPFFKGKKEYLEQCFGNRLDRYLSYCFPLIMFHDEWANVKEENFSYLVEDYRNVIENRGVGLSSEVTEESIPDQRQVNQKNLDELSIDILDKIMAECRANGANVIFFTCIWAGENEYREAMKKYANENECVYIDLFEHMDAMGFDEKTDLMDEGHLNSNGAGKVADYLSEYILKNYEL